MGFNLDGLSDFQKDLFNVAIKKLPKETPKLMRKVGSKGRTEVAKMARKLVKKKTGYYQKRWKRGKAFKDPEGKWVVRVYNSSPHAHLIEHGHMIYGPNKKEIGYSKGKKPLQKGWSQFESSDKFGAEVEKWLDKLLKDGKL